MRFFNLECFLIVDENNFILYFFEIELGCDVLDYIERVVEYVYF